MIDDECAGRRLLIPKLSRYLVESSHK